MANGSAGKILHVDLTSGSLTIEEPPEAFYRKYPGGNAMGLHYIKSFLFLRDFVSLW